MAEGEETKPRRGEKKEPEVKELRTQTLITSTSPRVIAGCLLTLLVVLLWVGSSVLSQFIFDNSDFGKPLFMTAFNSSLFTVYLLGFVFCKSWSEVSPTAENRGASEHDELFGRVDGMEYEASTPLLAPEPKSSQSEGANGNGKAHASNPDDPAADAAAAVAIAVAAAGHGHSHDHDHDHHHHGGDGSEEEEGRASETSSVLERRLERRLAKRRQQKLPWYKVAELAAWYVWVWLLGGYTYNVSLCFTCGTGTSVSVHTVISGTSALFALLMGYLLLNETRAATAANFVAVVVSTAGAALITGVDFAPGAGNTWQGDLLCGFSALCHGVSSVLLKKWMPHDDAVNMEMFFGFLGLWNTLICVPLLLLFDHYGIETFEGISQDAALCLLLNAILGTVVSNVLWAKAVVLTSPLLVNLGTTLTVPLAFMSDALNPYATHFKFKWQYGVGAAMVLGAFLAVNVTEETAERRKDGSESAYSGDDERRSRSVSLCAGPIIDVYWGGARIDGWPEGDALDWQI